MSETATRIDAMADRRRAARAALRLNATLREAGRSRQSARIIDLSTHGCRIESSFSASADSWLWLSVAGIETQYCRVVWRAQEFAGLEFATPLSEAVLARLLKDQETLSESTVKELRSIAKRTHRLATTQANVDTETLSELSRNCAVEAVIEGFRLSDEKSTPKAG